MRTTPGRCGIIGINAAAISHDTAVVAQAIVDAANDSGSAAPGTVAGTIPPVLLIDACITMTSSKLPPLFQYNHAIITEIAVTCSR